MIKIMFVCHGNICRSTMAEFVMKDLVHKAGMDEQIFAASSACRRDEIGSDTHPGTKAKLRQMEIPFTKRRAVQLTQADYAEYDYIAAMDRENLRDIPRIVGEDTLHKVFLLLHFAGQEREVADPWYTGNFDRTYDDVLRGCEALLAKIRGLS